jgi:phosphatidylglycerophosphate synthase
MLFVTLFLMFLVTHVVSVIVVMCAMVSGLFVTFIRVVLIGTVRPTTGDSKNERREKPR